MVPGGDPIISIRDAITGTADNPNTPEVSPNLRNYEPLRHCPRIPK